MPSQQPYNFRAHWNLAVSHFPARGAKGISYHRAEVEGAHVDCLLYRDKSGKIRGILFHNPTTIRDERAGNVTMFVDERFRRRGIGTRLLAEAVRRWPVNFDQQSYTDGGRALVKSVIGAGASGYHPE